MYSHITARQLPS